MDARLQGTETWSASARWAWTLVRLAVGWHLFHEGAVKLADPNWSAKGYLITAYGPFEQFFRWIADQPTLLRMVDLLNASGLSVLGALLVLGLGTRVAAALGAALLGLYYAAHPAVILLPPVSLPWVNPKGDLILNEVLLEALVLVALALVPGRTMWGLDAWICLRRGRRAQGELGLAEEPPSPAERSASDAAVWPRRAVLAHLVGLPVLGAWTIAWLRRRGWRIHEEEALRGRVDGTTSATIPTFQFSQLKDLTGRVPVGRLGSLQVSRLILGGNLIGGWAHARDLLYVSKLVKAYHHEGKVYETLALAEQCGINALLTNPILCDVINRYWKYTGGKILFISDCGGADLLERVRISIDKGAAACYVQGETADRLIRAGQVDTIAKALELIRSAHLPAGIGAHDLKTLQACVEHGLQVDFWMKTFHHLNYWSARPGEPPHDNRYCDQPEEVAAWMANRPEPWIAFKTLAAGAIHPRDGFRYALEHGADFLCVGMYDFQIVEDVNIFLSVLREVEPRRSRPWRG
jgi:uncharacterized membrane protein YphA (DoxX/SURF4 family)